MLASPAAARQVEVHNLCVSTATACSKDLKFCCCCSRLIYFVTFDLNVRLKPAGVSQIHLTLSRNTISQVLPYTFADLQDLHALHLDANRLTTLDDSHFQGLVNLRHLILANNQLHSISEGAFQVPQH